MHDISVYIVNFLVHSSIYSIPLKLEHLIANLLIVNLFNLITGKAANCRY